MFVRLIRIVATALVFASPLIAIPSPVYADCPDRPACRGCGCKGGPGYRGPDGKCVGFKNLTKVCGDPPDLRCTFENAPGTGANHDCALGLDGDTANKKEDN
jgi:hypothetical protein